VCAAPAVDSKIGFFDGFNGRLVGYCYLAFIGFTVIYQVLLIVMRKKQSANTS